MTQVYCTDLECVFNKTLTCQKEKIRLELVEEYNGKDNWICWDCKLPAGSMRSAPDSIPKKPKKPAKKGTNKTAVKKKAK